MVKPVLAQSTPTPSVPEFTLKLVGPPYLQNTTYSLDPNTGQIVAKIGYTNPYSALEINVKNQPFDSSYGRLYYNVRVKDHNETDNWIEAYRVNYFFPTQSIDSDYSNVGDSIEDYNFVGSLVGRQVDIQVEAMLGGIFGSGIPLGGDEFRGAVSGWSSTQTISIPANTPLSPTPAPSSSPTPNSTNTPTPTPTSTQSIGIVTLYQSVIIILVILLPIVAVISILLYRRHRR
jgi:hypothetical protein